MFLWGESLSVQCFPPKPVTTQFLWLKELDAAIGASEGWQDRPVEPAQGRSDKVTLGVLLTDIQILTQARKWRKGEKETATRACADTPPSNDNVNGKLM